MRTVRAIVLVTLVAATGAAVAARQEHATGDHQHPDAAKLQNPVAADATSIAAGKKLYTDHCSECHGEMGKGDGPAAEYNDPRPPDLTDAEWKHGSTDGEIYTVIHEGVKDTGMKSFDGKLTTHEMWDVVNYLRSIGKPVKSH